MKFADLHLHTIFSDSTYTPQELISEVSKHNLSCIAVVDHDTVDGIEPVIEASRTNNIEILPGIELTCEYDGLEVHILAYLIDYRSKKLREKLDFLKNKRIERVYKMVDRLRLMGINLKAESVFDIAGKGTVGRLHIARAMVKEGLVYSISDAFKKYIGDKSPAYVCGFRFSPKEAISLIKAVGGISVLAHPSSLNRDELVSEFADIGLMGLEVYYPEYTSSMTNFYLNLAKKLNLLITGGSDCHGDAKPEVKVGAVKIEYGLVENLKAAKQKLC